MEPTPSPEPTTPTNEFVPLAAEDITFAEGMEIPDATRDELLGIFNNQELDAKGRAQALIDLHTAQLQAASEASSQAWDSLQDQWQSDVRADPDVGGAKMQPVIDRVGRLVKEYGTDQLHEVFDMTGAGNNVHVIKFLNNIAMKLTEGEPKPGAPATAPGTAASRLFPSMKG